MIEPIWAGHSPEELNREFDPAAATIRHWLKQANLVSVAGMTGQPPPSAKRLPACAGRSNSCAWDTKSRQKPRPGSHGRPARSRPNLRVRKSAPGKVSDRHHVPRAGSLHQWVLRVAEACTFTAHSPRYDSDRSDPLDPLALARNLRDTPHPRRTCPRVCPCGA